MKKSIFRCVMAIAICFMFSQNALADLSVGLVAYYPFDRSAQDASGNSLNGAVINGGFRENRFGKANSALSGDVEVPDNDLLDFTSAFTLSAWLKVEAVPNQFGCWIGKDYTSSFASGIDAGNSLDCPGGSDVFRRMTVYIGDETSSFNDGPNFSCGTDTWYHVAVTFDDATDENKLYVNGVLSEKKGNSGMVMPNEYPLGIGKDGRYSDNFTGLIDNVRIYDRVLSDSEIISLFNIIEPGEMGDCPAPTSLSVKPKSSIQITLGWKDNSANETGFKIEKKIGACNSANPWAQIATKPANITTHTVTNLTPNTSYSFRVRAYQSSSNSTYSNCVMAKTSATGTPPAPTNFKATSASSTKVNLSWSDNSTDETGFRIYRKAGQGAWALLTTNAADVKNFSDTTATNNKKTTTYQYYIVASNASGKSPSTYTATVPYSPINLTAAQGATAGSIKLTWTDKSANETGFEIWRKTGDCSSTSTWTKVTTLGANKTSWTNTGLSSGNTYSYRIRAYKKTGSILPAYGYSMYSSCSSAIAQ